MTALPPTGALWHPVAATAERDGDAGRLPLPVSSFVGRAREVDDLAEVIASARLVTLIGMPGIGKTRLALEVATRVQPDFPGGVWFVDLSPVTEPGLVRGVVATSMRVPPEPGGDPIRGLVETLRSQRTLLVLDNCEHVLEACVTLTESLLAAVGDLSIVATTQRALDLPDEEIVSVSPMSLPRRTCDVASEALRSSEAVKLFCGRAEASNGAFRLTDELTSSVVEICHRLDGIPLAIELAAARVGVLAPVEIAERLEERFSLLTRGPASAPPRHQTLRAALDWSYELLAPPEAALLRRLAVFTGGASLKAVEEICVGGEVLRSQVVDLISELRARSLLTADTTSGLRARYQVLETVGDYGRMRLKDTDELETMRSRHATWCLEIAERAAPHGLVGDQDALDLLEVELDNLRSALEWASSGHEPELALRLALAINSFWSKRGHYREAQAWLERTLAINPEAPSPLRVRALCEIGMLAVLQGEVGTAVAAVEKGLAVARAAGLQRAEASSLNLLGFISIFSQDPLSAMPLLEDSVALTRAAGDVLLLRNSLELYGRSHLFAGNTGAARQVFEECLELTGDDDVQGLCGALIGLGWTAFAAGEQRRARELFDRALPLCQEGGDRFDAALVLSFLGELAWARGDMIEARSRLDEGLALAREMGAPFPLVRCLCALARVAMSGGDLLTAEELVDEACGRAACSRLPYASVRCLQVQGLVRLARGDQCGALGSFKEALSLARSNCDLAGRAATSHHLGRLARKEGSVGRAIDLHAGALALQARIPDAGGMASSLEALAGLVLRGGRRVHAARLFGAAEAIRDDAGALRPDDEAESYESDVIGLGGAGDDPEQEACRAEVDEAWAAGTALSRCEAVALATRGRGRRDRPCQGMASLTPAEREVFDLAVQGMTNNEIAEKLFLSTRTVQGRLLRIFPKLTVTSRRQLRELDLGDGEP